MHLPEHLKRSLEKLLDGYGLNDLITAHHHLSNCYRQPDSKQIKMNSDLQRVAYILARMPATFATIMKVFMTLKQQASLLEIKSLLDLGAGPGTASWAAHENFSTLEKLTLIEQDPSFIKMGQMFMSDVSANQLRTAEWQNVDLMQQFPNMNHDLVIFSYSIGELPSEFIPQIVEKAWLLANKALVIIEPGTPVGFERMRLIRQQLLELNAHLLAPCPHQSSCPIAKDDWCHFSARVERSSYHRLLKSATLNYEDEKFSYLIATKEPCKLPNSRIIRHPLHRSGHTILTLCTEEGIKQETISKKYKEAYREAKKADWGSSFSFVLPKK